MSKSISSRAPVEVRTIRLIRQPGAHLPGKFSITENGETSVYTFSRLESQIGGQAFQVNKLEYVDGVLTIGKSYDVLLNGQRSSCDCPWGCYGAHKKPCRHLAGLAKLIAEGKLP